MAYSNLVYVFVIFSSILFFTCYSNALMLIPNYYATSCPNLEKIVTNTMAQAVAKEPRMGASILRLFFHDCFVNGCDGSVLLADTTTLTGERNAFANANNSIRGFEVIDEIKSNVEASCSNVVSCADILALAARDGVNLLGGPTWMVLLGRKDATTASLTLANQNLPPPFSNLTNLTSLFQKQGLSPRDMTALSGAHTTGLARCTSFRAHIYKDTNIDPTFAASRQSNCLPQVGNGDFNLAPLDLQTPTSFDNDYYQNLIVKRGLLHSDQELFNGGSQDSLVKVYSSNRTAFFLDFVDAMIKMGNISPLTGTQGEIRKNCQFVN